MYKRYKISFLIFIVSTLITPVCLFSQNEDDLATFLKAGEEDASKLIQAYTEPIIKTLSYGMTGGWYNTAAAHKPLGFDFGVTMNLAFVPTADNYFNPDKLGLSSTYTFFNTTKNNPTQAPTIMGPKDDTDYTFSGNLDGNTGNGDESVTISGPEGLNLKNEIGFAAIPVPMAQLGIGIIKNTDLKVRFMPNQKFGSSEIKMFGIGVMHDVKQHIKGIKLLPFDLSALVAYNSISGTSDLSNTDPSDERPDSPDGVLDYKFNSWVIQALISKKISVLTGYAGVGYCIVNTKVDVKGQYTIEATPFNFQLTDPVAIDFKNNTLRLTVGMRLKLGPVYFSGDYTLQKYNTLSVGFGFAVR